MKSKNRLYSASVILLAAVLTVIHTVALLTTYDTEVGYFESTPLILILRITYAVGTAWCATVPFLMPTPTPSSRPQTILRLTFKHFAAILLLFSGISALAKSFGTTSLTTPSILPILGILAALSSSFFFTAPTTDKKPGTAHALCGFVVLAFLFCFLFHVYFDMHVTINSPLKTALQLSILSAMLFILFEIRSALGKPMPRITLAPRLLCILFCIPTAVAHLFFGASELCGVLERTVISPVLSLPLLAIGAFALSELNFNKE